MNRFFRLVLPCIILTVAVGCAAKINTQPKPENNVSGIKEEKEEPTEPEKLYPLEWDDGGIFASAYSDAYAKLKTMTIEEKAGQVLLARCPKEKKSEFINAYNPGGFVMSKNDFENKSKDQVKNEIAAFQSASSIPMIIAVDEEGGDIVPISCNPMLSENKFKSPHEIYSEGGMESIAADATKKAELLVSLGVNLNLAPVADVSTNKDAFIYSRSLGAGSEETAEFVSLVVHASKELGLSSALKHFPGYGNNGDTHISVSIDKRPYENFENSDFIPFKAGIDAGADFVLISHNIIEAVDPKYPSSLSPEIHEILRNTLEFTGIVLTDDLETDAIKVYSHESSPVVALLNADNDMIAISDIQSGVTDICNAINNGDLPVNVLDKAVFKVLAYKYSNGMN